jgi:hypothetical protein
MMNHQARKHGPKSRRVGGGGIRKGVVNETQVPPVPAAAPKIVIGQGIIRCSKCEFKTLLKSSLDKHEADVHDKLEVNNEADGSPPSSENRSSSYWKQKVKCPKCPAKLQPFNLPAHLKVREQRTGMMQMEGESVYLNCGWIAGESRSRGISMSILSMYFCPFHRAIFSYSTNAC